MFGNFVNIVIWVMGCKFPRTFAAMGIAYFVTHFLFTKYMLFGTILLAGGPYTCTTSARRANSQTSSSKRRGLSPQSTYLMPTSSIFRRGSIHISVNQQKNQEQFRCFDDE